MSPTQVAGSRTATADAAGSVRVPAWTRPIPKQLFIHRLFSEIAPRYDWFNRLASFGLDQRWRERAVELSGLATGMRALDVCTGTGDLALLCARSAGADGLDVGIDFTAPMLERAQAKQRRQAASVGWSRADAQRLPFAEGRFDRVVIGFSTRNLADLADGLREMLRVVKPGGALVVLETGRPPAWWLRIGYWVFLHTIAPAIGWLLTGQCWPFTYLARSTKGFLPPTEFVRLLNACGAQASYLPLSGGLASLYIARKSVPG